MNTAATTANQPRRITGRTVLIGFILFFGLIGAVNGLMAYLALDSWPGLTTEDAYDKGLAYNNVLADGERQAALGWTSAVSVSDGALVVRMATADERPLAGMKVNATLSRPVGEAVTRAVEPRAVADGIYRAPVALPLAGRWKVEIGAVAPSGQTYRMIHEVMIEP